MENLKIVHESIDVSFNKTLKLQGITIEYDLVCAIYKETSGKLLLTIQEADNYKTTFLGKKLKGWKEFHELNNFLFKSIDLDLQAEVEKDCENYQESELLAYYLKNKTI